MLMRNLTLGKQVRVWGLATRGANYVIRGLELSFPPPTSWEMGRSWSCNQLPTAKDSIRFPRWLSGKRIRLPMQEMQETQFNPWVGKVPWRRKWQTAPVFLPGNFHGQRSLAGYTP